MKAIVTLKNHYVLVAALEIVEQLALSKGRRADHESIGDQLQRQSEKTAKTLSYGMTVRVREWELLEPNSGWSKEYWRIAASTAEACPSRMHPGECIDEV